jgi:glycosyltransferase involved in cell wall biosynthesis
LLILGKGDFSTINKVHLKSAAPMPEPRVLQIFNRYLERGGEESAVRQFAEILAPQCNFAECLFESAEWKGADAPPKWKQMARTFYNPDAVGRLRQRQIETGANVWLVHNIFPVASPAVYSEALRQSMPVVQVIHNFRPFSITGYLDNVQAVNARHWPRTYCREVMAGAWQRSRLKTLLLGSVLCSMRLQNQFSAVKAWIAVSEFVRTQFIAAGVPAQKIFRLYHPRVLVNSNSTFAEEDYYLFLGRLMEEKGIKVVMAAWEILRRRLGDRTPRLVVGGEGPLLEWTKSAAASNPAVKFAGFVTGDEKHRLLAGCRAILQPSICAEALPVVIYEAFDYGKPVLAAASGGMPELIGERNGLIHQPGDAAQLAAQVEEAEHRGRDWRRRSGESGRKWLLANTNVNAWKEQLFEIIRYAQRTNSQG